MTTTTKTGTHHEASVTQDMWQPQEELEEDNRQPTEFDVDIPSIALSHNNSLKSNVTIIMYHTINIINKYL